MRVFIECPENPKEWFMIELQGEVEAKKGNTVLPSLNGIKLGDLFEKDGKIYLVISNHELEGHIVKLDKPLLAFQRIRKQNENDNNQSPQTYYTISGIVRKKYIFSSRPKALLF